MISQVIDWLPAREQRLLGPDDDMPQATPPFVICWHSLNLIVGPNISVQQTFFCEIISDRLSWWSLVGNLAISRH